MTDQNISMHPLGDEVAVVNPGRVLDNSNAHEMIEVLSKALQSGFKYIIVDLTELQFLSSAGVGSILGTVESSRESGGDIVLCNPADTIRHILTVLDLTEYLTITSDRADALQRCGITG